jgi:hypothetical protein
MVFLEVGIRNTYWISLRRHQWKTAYQDEWVGGCAILIPAPGASFACVVIGSASEYKCMHAC